MTICCSSGFPVSLLSLLWFEPGPYFIGDNIDPFEFIVGILLVTLSDVLFVVMKRGVPEILLGSWWP